MYEEGSHTVVPFQLQFDKQLPSQIKIAEWNPEKDLLAMVTEDSKIVLHRFNWQRLWTISPGRQVTSLCWRPDGKVIAVGQANGIISLHDVENGRLMKSMKLRSAADVTCLCWEYDERQMKENLNNSQPYEDRTGRFFPAPPRTPRTSGVVTGDNNMINELFDSFRELLSSSCQRFSVLCSGDKNGIICFFIFGFFPAGSINLHEIFVDSPVLNRDIQFRVTNSSIYKVAFSKSLCRLVVIFSGKFHESAKKCGSVAIPLMGMHCFVFDTSIFTVRQMELHQLAQHASHMEDLMDVLRISISVMSKQWSDAMHVFHERFDSLSNLIADHGLESCPEEEFLSLLCGVRTSPALHQFLVSSLGEVGWKRVSKVVGGAGHELQRVVLDHLQPAAEIIGFRLGELRGLARWRARFKDIELSENILDNATEKCGMILVQIERFMEVLSSVVYQFSNFFVWLHRCIKQLMQEPIDQTVPHNSELVVMFLKFLYGQDPVKQLLEGDGEVQVNIETMERVKELIHFGGFSDCEYLHRTLTKQFQEMQTSIEDVFEMPYAAISKQIICVAHLPLIPFPTSSTSLPPSIPMSISFYKETPENLTPNHKRGDEVVDYICFVVPPQSNSDAGSTICFMRGVAHGFLDPSCFEAAVMSIPCGFECIDLSFYKDSQLILLLNETPAASEHRGRLLCLQVTDLRFAPVSRAPLVNWASCALKDSKCFLEVDGGRVRGIPHPVVAPLAVSASRGLASVFAARKRALVYILDEDEEADE